MDYLRRVTRMTCRGCGHPRLNLLYDFGRIAVSDFVSHPTDKGKSGPVELTDCPECGLVQLRHTMPMDAMYKHYWYRSGMNQTILKDLKAIVQEASALVGLQKGDTVLDIGSNDSSLLRLYPQDVHKVGCEPAENFRADLDGAADYPMHCFWNADRYKAPKAKIVTALGMLYDSDDPRSFVNDVAKVLDDDGIFICQLVTLRGTVELNDVSNILCFEHLNFFPFRSLEKMFNDAGLEIFRAETTPINGMSYKLYARKGNKPLGFEEKKVDWDAFVGAIEENRTKTVAFIHDAKMNGAQIYGYAASTKFNGLLQWYGLDSSLISGVAEQMPEKIGKYTVGTGIPIVPEAYAREQADFFLVGPFAFLDAFMEKEAAWREEGGVFITHSPTFRLC